MGNINLCYHFTDNKNKMIANQWGRKDDIVLMSHNHVQIVDVKHPYQVKSTMNLPEELKFNDVSEITWIDSILQIHSYYDGYYVAYNYKYRKPEMENLTYTLDGQSYLYESRYGTTDEVICARTKGDSTLWRINGHLVSVSPNRKKCVIEYDLSNYNSGHSSIMGIKLVDIPTGEIMFEKNSASFRTFLSDDIFVYSIKDSIFIAEAETKHNIYYGKDNGYLNMWMQYGFICANGNDKICIFTDSLGVKVYNFCKHTQTINIPLLVDKIESIRIGVSPLGDNLFIIQMYEYEDKVYGGHDYSIISVWDIAKKKCVINKQFDELYYRGYITSKGYLILFALNQVSIYEVGTRNKISTIHLNTMPSGIIELPDGNVLLETLQSVFEVDPKRGMIIEEKEYLNGIGNRIIGNHYIMSGYNLIDLNTDKIVLRLDRNDNLISIKDSIMIIERVLDNNKRQEILIPFDEKKDLVRRVRRIVGKRVLTPQERARYKE